MDIRKLPADLTALCTSLTHEDVGMNSRKYVVISEEKCVGTIGHTSIGERCLFYSLFTMLFFKGKLVKV